MNRVKVTVLLRDPRDVLNVPKVIPRVKMKVVKVGKSGYTVKKAGILWILKVQKYFNPPLLPQLPFFSFLVPCVLFILMFCYNLNKNDCFRGYGKVCEIYVEVEKRMITNYFLQIVKRNLTTKNWIE